MYSPRKQIIGFIEQGAIAPHRIDEALSAAKVLPDRAAWRAFIDNLLLWLGGLALAFAALFFIAYNWTEMGRFAKFAMVEVFIVLAVGAYWKLGEHQTWGKVSLLMATIFLGVLLALYGQTYQTGADTWQLFFNWALLMTPWALIGRFPAIWIVWIALINASIMLHPQVLGGFGWGSEVSRLWLLFLFNTLALGAWEFLAHRWSWLAERWALRLLGTASGCFATMLAIDAIWGKDLWGLIWVPWLVAMYIVYRRVKPDLYMLAGCCLSGIVVAISLLTKVTGPDAGTFFLLAMFVIGMGGGSAVWLKSIQREMHS